MEAESALVVAAGCVCCAELTIRLGNGCVAAGDVLVVLNDCIADDMPIVCAGMFRLLALLVCAESSDIAIRFAVVEAGTVATGAAPVADCDSPLKVNVNEVVAGVLLVVLLFTLELAALVAVLLCSP